MKPDFSGGAGALLDKCVSDYDSVVRGIDAEAEAQSGRAYGGVVRMTKGGVVENIAEFVVYVESGHDIRHGGLEGFARGGGK